MDFDGLSSPPAMRSSLPPSSAPDPSQSTNQRPPRRPIDVLTLGDDDPEEEGREGREGSDDVAEAKGT